MVSLGGLRGFEIEINMAGAHFGLTIPAARWFAKSRTAGSKIVVDGEQEAPG